MSGPLTGVRVIELAGIGPGPHAGMMLAELGADVVRVDRPATGPEAGPADPLSRGRRTVMLDLKSTQDHAQLLRMVAAADVLLEGYRPGVMERLGLGPQTCRTTNPRLVYARITGWGQTGPLAQRAGHDLNYVAVTGVLSAIGRADDRPVVPLNLVGDYGGGSMLVVVGILAALVERDRSGQGQVIDAAMVDGASLLARLMWALRGLGGWHDQRESNLLDGGAPFYDTYQCADGRFVAVAALEPAFWAQMLRGLGLSEADVPDRNDVGNWPAIRARLAQEFATRSRDDWAQIFVDTDACVTPVLSFNEAAAHPHLAARATLVERDATLQPAPAPRFSRTPSMPVPLSDLTVDPADVWVD